MKTVTKLWIGLAILAALSPLGLLLPERFRAGAAWGEWAPGELRKLAGYIPQGLEKLSTIWNAPVQEYGFKGFAGRGIGYLSIGYLISAVLGICITVVAMMLLGKLLVKKR